MKRCALRIGVLAAVWGSIAEGAELSAVEILDKIDKLYRAENSQARVKMQIKTPEYERTLEMDVYSEGVEKTFVRILAPEKNKGVSTLRIGKEMWNYFPNINKVMVVPPSMMMASWMGSDFTNDDLVKESTLQNDYTHKRLASEGGLIVIELTPKETTATVWGKILLHVKPDVWLPVRQKFYDEKGVEKRVICFEGVQSMGGRTIPTLMRLENLAKPGQSTVLRYVEARFDVGLPKDTFTLQKLRKSP